MGLDLAYGVGSVCGITPADWPYLPILPRIHQSATCPALWAGSLGTAILGKNISGNSTFKIVSHDG